jgi:F-type H+-transporting ATPase subunit a
VAGPIAQFELTKLVPLKIFGLDASFTNSSLFMALAVGGVSAFMINSMKGRSLVPTRLQSVAEMMYDFVATTVRENVGHDGMKFFPFVFSLFIFVLALNMLGMVPGGFTVTSHLIITAALAMLVMTVVILYGLYKHGLGFLKLFVPSDVPMWLMPLLVPIEIISFLSRPISLSVRLFANMLAGHIALKIFAGFCATLLLGTGVPGIFKPLAILPLGLSTALTALEFLVAGLQAYVFAVLTCVYLNDAVHGSH